MSKYKLTRRIHDSHAAANKEVMFWFNKHATGLLLGKVSCVVSD
jgi:hypothetical protein